MPKDIKLFALAKQLNVGIGSLKESLERRNVPNMEKITPNTRVSQEIAMQLLQEHGKHLGKERLEEILHELDGSAPAKPQVTESEVKETKEEKKPKGVKHIETEIPEEKRPSLNIKGTIKQEAKKQETKPTATPKAESKAEAKPKAETKRETKPTPKAEPKKEPTPQPETEPQPEPKPEIKAEVAPTHKAPAKEEVTSTPTPTLVEVKEEVKASVEEPTPTPEGSEVFRPSPAASHGGC